MNSLTVTHSPMFPYSSDFSSFLALDDSLHLCEIRDNNNTLMTHLKSPPGTLLATPEPWRRRHVSSWTCRDVADFLSWVAIKHRLKTASQRLESFRSLDGSQLMTLKEGDFRVISEAGAKYYYSELANALNRVNLEENEEAPHSPDSGFESFVRASDEEGDFGVFNSIRDAIYIYPTLSVDPCVDLFNFPPDDVDKLATTNTMTTTTPMPTPSTTSEKDAEEPLLPNLGIFRKNSIGDDDYDEEEEDDDDDDEDYQPSHRDVPKTTTQRSNVRRRGGKRRRATSSTSTSGDGTPRVNHRGRNPRSRPLWKFFIDLLNDRSTNPRVIEWEDRNRGQFKVRDTTALGRLWGDEKGNDTMNYDKLARAIRFYYKKKVFSPVVERRLSYQFGEKAKWRELVR